MNKWKILRNISGFILCSAITAFILGLTFFKGFLNLKELLFLFVIFIIFSIITYIFGDMAKREERKRRRQNRNKKSRLYKSKEDKNTKDNFTNSYMEQVKDLEKSFMEIRQLADNTNDPMEKLMRLWKTLALYRQAKVFSYIEGDEVLDYFNNNWENQKDIYSEETSYEDRLLEDIKKIEYQIQLNKLSSLEKVDTFEKTSLGEEVKEDDSNNDSLKSLEEDSLNSLEIDNTLIEDLNINTNENDKENITEDLDNNDITKPLPLDEILVDSNGEVFTDEPIINLQEDENISNNILELNKSILNYEKELNEENKENKDIKLFNTSSLPKKENEVSDIINIDENLQISNIPVQNKYKPKWLEDYKKLQENKDKKKKENGIEDIIEEISSEEDLLSVEDLITIDIFNKNITDIDKVLMSKVDFIYRNIVFLNWCDKKGLGLDADFYPDEIRYDLNIFLPHNRHKKFISLGLLQKHTYKDMLNSFKVTELREILRQNNLKVSGLKKDLVNRILKNTDLDDLELTYTLTNKGKDLINRYYPFVKFYGRNDLNISLDNFYLSWLKLEHSEKYDETPPFIKIIVGAYRARAFEAAYRKMYSTLRDINDDIFDIVFNINGDEDFLQVVVDVICIDLCGLDDESKIDIDSIKLCDDYVKYFLKNSDLYDDSYVDRAFDNNNINNYALIKDYIKSLLYSLIKNPDKVEEYLKDYKKSLKAKIEAIK